MSAILFDRDQVDHIDDLSDRPDRLRIEAALGRPPRRTEFSAEEVADALDLDDQTRRFLATPNEKAGFNDHGRYIHITTYAPREDEEGELHAVECVVGENWVVTAHDEPIPVLEEFADRVSGSGDTGSLDGPFPGGAARMGTRRLHGRVRADRAASGGVRRPSDARRGRRQGHRDARRDAPRGRQPAPRARGAPLRPRRAHPSRAGGARQQRSGERFQSLFSRFEATLQEARDAREAIVGSFDVLIARGGHHTNQIMKVLTLTSVILLPGALLAGVMGMNFKVGLSITHGSSGSSWP